MSKMFPISFDSVITCDESCVLLRPKIEIRKFALEVVRFSMKKEDAPAEIGGEGAHGGFFQQSRTHLSAHSPQESENYCCVLLWGIATVAAAYSNEEAGVEASMDLAPH